MGDHSIKQGINSLLGIANKENILM